MAKKFTPQPKKLKSKFVVEYFRWMRTALGHKKRADAHGHSLRNEGLENLTRNAAGRLAIENYRRAFIYAVRGGVKGECVRVLTRTSLGITISSPEER